MYVTRPLSLYRRSPECLSQPPPEGPNSGYLVILDEEAETSCCFGFCRDCYVRDLPLPQNKNLTINYSDGENNVQYHVLFVPVLNQPLSSNQYYVIRRKGKHKGKACTNSKEEDKWSCCFCTCIKDVKPREFDPSDTYQQVKIFHKKFWGFSAKSVAQDGFPPHYLRRKYWTVSTTTPKSYQLHEASGLNSSLRNRLPNFNPSLSETSTTNKASEPVVVGKWYCPFMFVHEKGMKLNEQMKKSTFYQVTLEQRWEKIFACDNTEVMMKKKNKVVNVDVIVEKEEVSFGGELATVVVGDDDKDVRNKNGVLWFRTASVGGGGAGGGGEEDEKRVGLSKLVVERMKWEEGRVGWSGGGGDDDGETQVRVKRAEECGGIGGYWSKFGCFVLVERFVFKRMDGSVMFTYDFNHTHQIRSKWE